MRAYTPRHEWGSQARGGHEMGRVSELIVHHFYIPDVSAWRSSEYESGILQSVEDYHVREFYGGNYGRGGGTGYQFIVFQSGRAYEGRGWFRTGAHTVGRNSKSVSICFAINGDEHEVSDAAWEAARRIAAEGVQIGALTADYTLSGHHDYSGGKSCPGKKVYPVIGEHLSSSLIDKEDIVSYDQAVVVPDGGDRWDEALGTAIAVWHTLALVEADDNGNLTSDGRTAEVGEPILVGATQGLDLPNAHVVAGGDADATAEAVARFIAEHPKRRQPGRRLDI